MHIPAVRSRAAAVRRWKKVGRLRERRRRPKASRIAPSAAPKYRTELARPHCRIRLSARQVAHSQRAVRITRTRSRSARPRRLSRLAALDHPSGVRAIAGTRQHPPRIRPERIHWRTPFSRARTLPRSRIRRSHVSNSPASSRGTFKAREHNAIPTIRSVFHARWDTSGANSRHVPRNVNINRIEDRGLATRIPN